MVGVTVGIRELRNNLRTYLQRAKNGEEVAITDRGKVIARIVPLEHRSKRDELIARGIITPARRPRQPVDLARLVELDAPLSEEIVRLRGPD